MADAPTPPASAPPPTPSTESPRRPWTILGRLTEAVREQNWFAVGLEVLIVIVGVVVGFQVTGWGQARSDAAREQTYLRQLAADLAETERIITATDSSRYAQWLPAASRLLRSFGHSPKPPADSVLAWFPDAWTLASRRPVLGTTHSLIGSGDLNLIRDDSLRTAIVAYLDQNEFWLDEQRIQFQTAEEAGKVLATRIDIPEWLATTLPDSVREQMSRDWEVGGLIPTGDWVAPNPLDAEAFYADPRMYTNAFSLGLETQHIAQTQRRMRESAAALREQVEAQIER
ncbi:hypothetical protein [Rubrivirga sp. IMCC43871]|uniref:hypothetical protein n=1 Tax=Rubrivirga sp. IMCC43871 TaxID=3391575 RepID=UPI00399010C4